MAHVAESGLVYSYDLQILNMNVIQKPQILKLSNAKILGYCGEHFPIPKFHDDVIKWKHFPRYWPFVRGIHRSPVNSPHKGQWRGALMFTLICVWTNGCVNNRETGDLRRYCAYYGVTVMHRLKFSLTPYCVICSAIKWKYARWIVQRNHRFQFQSIRYLENSSTYNMKKLIASNVSFQFFGYCIHNSNFTLIFLVSLELLNTSCV